MPNQSIVIIKMGIAVLYVGLLAGNPAATPCWGMEQVGADATITLETKNEPLRSVLGKITKATRWKINAPDKWMDKPVTQTLNKVSLEEGLKSVLNNAGVENLLLMYDENAKVVTLFDTESPQRQSAADRSTGQAPAQPPVQVNTQPTAVPTDAEPDPILQRPVRNPGPGPERVNRRVRRPSSDDD